MTITQLREKIIELQKTNGELSHKLEVMFQDGKGDSKEFLHLDAVQTAVQFEIAELTKQLDRKADQAAHRRVVREVLNKPKNDTYKPFEGIWAMRALQDIA